MDAQPREPHVHAQIRTGPGGGFLIGAGGSLLLAATALLLVPVVSPEQSGIVRTLADLGVTSLPLYAAGILFCGLWLAVRTSREHSIAAQHAALSAGPAIEALSDKLIDLRDSFQGVRLEFVYLKDVVQAQIERQNQAAQRDTHAEGMYRLAASLDQLGQRVEHQIGAGQNEMREKLESLWSAIEVLRHERHDGRIHLGDEEDLHEDSLEELHREELHPEELHSEATLPAADAPKLLPAPTDHESPASRERLGILDLIDDLGRLLPKKSAPSSASTPLITPDAFEGVQDEGWDRHQTLAGPLPSIRPDPAPDSGSRVGELLARADVHEPSDDLTIVRKLEELRSLLADARVREALTSMDRID